MPRLLALSLFLVLTPILRAQTDAVGRADLAVTFDSQYSLKASTTDRFWMEGGSIELGVNVWRGFGVSADITGTHTSSIGSSGAPLSLVTATFGPNYRWHPNRRVSLYGEGLAGEANAFHTLIPTSFGTQSDGNGLATLVDGGVDLRISHHYAVRVLDLAWLRTEIPNGTDNVQNNFRLAAGLVLRFGQR